MSTTSPHDNVTTLLAAVPYQLGFTPRESIVVAGLDDRGRVTVTARGGIDDLSSPIGAVVAGQLASVLVQAGSVAAFAVAYTDIEPVAGQHLDVLAADAWRVIDDALPGAVASAVIAQAGRRTYAPVHGMLLGDPAPIEGLKDTEVAARMVAAGAAPAGSREDLGVLPAVSPDAHEAAAAGAAQLRSDRSQYPASRPTAWHGAELALWRIALDHPESSRLDAGVLGRMAEGLEDKRLRDEVLALIVEKVSGRATGNTHVERASLAIRMVVDPSVAVAPRTNELAVADRVLRTVAAHRTPQSAPALTLAAVGSWWAGHGAAADVLTEKAKAIEPTYSLAGLMTSALSAGLPPGWVRAGQRPANDVPVAVRAPDRFVSIPDPADPFGMPIYEGDPAEAGNLLVDGVYRGTILDDMEDPDAQERPILLSINDRAARITDLPQATSVEGAPPATFEGPGLGL